MTYEFSLILGFIFNSINVLGKKTKPKEMLLVGHKLA